MVRREFAEAGLPLIDNARLALTPDRELVEAAPRAWHCAASMTCGGASRTRGRRWTACRLRCRGCCCRTTRTWRRGGLRRQRPARGPDDQRPHPRRPDLRPRPRHAVRPLAYGQKYAQGLVQGPVCPVFVSRGIGVATVPLRLGVPPEISVLELRRDTPA